MTELIIQAAVSVDPPIDASLNQTVPGQNQPIHSNQSLHY